MAAAKKPTKAKEELVPFYAFKDSDKYQDDIIVTINGKAWRIKRGEEVMIPKSVYMVLMNSQKQDGKTADFIARETERYRAGSRIFE